jgi:hypothetical protein
LLLPLHLRSLQLRLVRLLLQLIEETTPTLDLLPGLRLLLPHLAAAAAAPVPAAPAHAVQTSAGTAAQWPQIRLLLPLHLRNLQPRLVRQLLLLHEETMLTLDLLPLLQLVLAHLAAAAVLAAPTHAVQTCAGTAAQWPQRRLLLPLHLRSLQLNLVHLLLQLIEETLLTLDLLPLRLLHLAAAAAVLAAPTHAVQISAGTAAQWPQIHLLLPLHLRSLQLRLVRLLLQAAAWCPHNASSP